MSKLIEYSYEQGVAYRHLKENQQPEKGETLRTYHAYHHHHKYSIIKRIAIARPHRVDFLELLNHWNRQPGSGWSYHSLER